MKIRISQKLLFEESSCEEELYRKNIVNGRKPKNVATGRGKRGAEECDAQEEEQKEHILNISSQKKKTSMNMVDSKIQLAGREEDSYNNSYI